MQTHQPAEATVGPLGRGEEFTFARVEQRAKCSENTDDHPGQLTEGLQGTSGTQEGGSSTTSSPGAVPFLLQVMNLSQALDICTPACQST